MKGIQILDVLIFEYFRSLNREGKNKNGKWNVRRIFKMKTSEEIKDLEEITFKDYMESGNNIYKKNCAVYYKIAAYYGFTETMFDILYFVRENEEYYTQAQLCSSLYLRKQTVNTALKKLEKDGYIYLKKEAGNEKNKTIHFTEKGEELARNTIDQVFELEKRAFERLSTEERKGAIYYGMKQIEVLEEELDRLEDGQERI